MDRALACGLILSLSWGQGNQDTASEKLPRIEPLEGELRVWRGGTKKTEKLSEAAPVAPQDRLGTAGGSPGRLSVEGGEIYLSLKGVEPGLEEGLSVVRSAKKVTLKLYRGRVVVESVDSEVSLEAPQGVKVVGKSAYFLVEATRDSVRIVPFDGKLQVTHDLGPVEIGPGETVTMTKDKPPQKRKATSPEADLAWTSEFRSANNLIKNPGFENGLDGWVVLRTAGRNLVRTDEKIAFGGQKSARIDLPNIDFTESSVPLDLTGNGGCALLQVVNDVKPGARYVLKFWIRTENYAVDGGEVPVTFGVYARVVGRDDSDASPLSCPRANGEWRCARFLLEANTEGHIEIRIPKLKDDKSKARGTIWIDEVALIPSSAPRANDK